MEKSSPGTRKRMFPFFFSPYSLFLRLNIEQQVRSLHKYLLRTWGGGKGLEPWPERGARGGSDRGTYRGDGGGGAGKERNGARRGAGGGGGSRSRPRGPSRYPPASATVYPDRQRARSCVRNPSPPPTLPIGKLRPRAIAERRETTRPTKVTRQASGSRTPGLIGSVARAPLSPRAEAQPEAFASGSGSDPAWRDRGS